MSDSFDLSPASYPEIPAKPDGLDVGDDDEDDDTNEEVGDVEEEIVEPHDDVHSLAKQRADRVRKQLTSSLMYAVDDNPPWYTTIMLALQHFLSLFGFVLAVPIFLAPYLCIKDDLDSLSRVIASTFFVTSLQTLIQATFGVRLPIVQGPSFVYVLPVFVILKQRGECPVIGGNATDGTIITRNEVRNEFMIRMNEYQGALIIASIFETLIGIFGIVGLILRFIGPLTIAPTIGLIGLVLFDSVTNMAATHWGISGFTMVLVLVFAVYMEKLRVPCLGYKKEKRFHLTWYPLFRVFPICLAMLIAWLLCYILTVTDVLPNDPEHTGYRARTDINADDLAATPWFFFPYPGQWGTPIVTTTGFLGMCVAFIASMVESIGDYYACAALSGAPPPPSHAINRGIAIEGVGCFLSAVWGTGSSTCSYSANIGILGITKVGSRVVVQVLSAIVLLGGFCLKFSAFFASIPEPVIGGVVSVAIGIIAAVGFSSLSYTDMKSPRNLTIVGFSFYMGLAIPSFMLRNPGILNTGSVIVDQILEVVLSTGIFLGGLVGFILDNTVPGTPEERGIQRYWKAGSIEINESDNINPNEEEIAQEAAKLVNASYDLPFGMRVLRKWKWTRYLPISPTFQGFKMRRPRGYRFSNVDCV